MNKSQSMSSDELGKKLLKSVHEMQASNAARVTKVEPNKVAKAIINSGQHIFYVTVTLDNGEIYQLQSDVVELQKI